MGSPQAFTQLPRPPHCGGREPSLLGLEGVNFVRGLSESDTPQAAMEIPCAWHVVTQKRETVLFGAEDKAGWSLGADACPGWGRQASYGQGDLASGSVQALRRRREVRRCQARPGHAMVLSEGLGRSSAKSKAKEGTQAMGATEAEARGCDSAWRAHLPSFPVRHGPSQEAPLRCPLPPSQTTHIAPLFLPPPSLEGLGVL